jgi:hypothetical protein
MRYELYLGIMVVKWFDNGPVHIASNFAGVQPMVIVGRWCPDEKKRKTIVCPRVVKAYNGGMCGVDFPNILISLYRIKVKSRR